LVPGKNVTQMTPVFVFQCRGSKVEAQQDELEVTNNVFHFDTVRGWLDGQIFLSLYVY